MSLLPIVETETLESRHVAAAAIGSKVSLSG
jgi:hypothetical protein